MRRLFLLLLVRPHTSMLLPAWGSAVLVLAGAIVVACGKAPTLPGEEPGGAALESCGDNVWGQAGELPNRVYVATWGQPDGAGTRDDPLDTIQAGLDRAAWGSKEGVVVAGEDAGSVYPEQVTFERAHDGLSLRGRCAERVTIGGVDANLHFSVLVRAGRASLADLTLEGAIFGLAAGCTNLSRQTPEVVGSHLVVSGHESTGVMAVGEGLCLPSMHLFESRIVDNMQAGISSHWGAEVRLTDCSVTDNGSEVESSSGAFGVTVGNRGRAILERTSVRGNRGIGVHVAGPGSTVELLDSSVLDTGPINEQDGSGLVVTLGGHAVARNTMISGVTGSGVWAYEDGTAVELYDVSILTVLERDGAGRGIAAGAGALVQVQGGRIEDTVDSSVLAAGARVLLQGTNLSDNVGSSSATYGAALTAVSGGFIQARGVTISDVGFAGVLAIDGGAEVDLADVLIDRVHGGGLSEDDAVARGIYVREGAEVRAEDVEITRVDGTGALVTGPGATLLFDGLEAVDTGLTETGWEGYGLAVGANGRADGDDLTIRGSARRSVRITGELARGEVRGGTLGPASDPDCAAQLLVSGGGQLELASVTVPDPCMGSLHATGGAHVSTQWSRFGAGSLFGIAAADGSRLEDVGSTIEATSGVALLGMGKDTSMSLLETRIEGPQSGIAGRGIDLARGAGLDATGLVVEGVEDLGIFVDGTGTRALLRECLIAGTRPGGFVGAGLGLTVQGGGRVDARGTAILDGAGPGILAQEGGVLVGQDLRLEGNAFSGALVLAGGVVDLTRGTVRANPKHPADGGGFGVYAAATDLPVWLRLRDVELREQPSSALHLVGAGSFHVEGGSITGSPEHTWLPDGVLLADQPLIESHPGSGEEGLGLHLHDVAFFDMDLAVLLDAATAVVDGCWFDQVETAFWVENCEEVPPLVIDGASMMEACGDTLRPVRPLDFYKLGEVGLQPLGSAGVSEPFVVPSLLDSLPTVEAPPDSDR